MNWLRGWKRLRYIIGIGVTVYFYCIGREIRYWDRISNGRGEFVSVPVRELETKEMLMIIVGFWIVLLLVHKPIVWVINGFRKDK